MSHLLDFMLKPEADMDVSAMLPDDIHGMDIPLNFDNSELMSSDFFDSVLSMEKQNLDDGFLCDLNYEGNSSDNILASPSDPMTSENNSLDGDHCQQQDPVLNNNSIRIFGRNSDETLNGDEFLSLLEQHNIQSNINDILGVTNTPKVVARPPQTQTKKIIITKPVLHPKKCLQPVKKQQVIRVQSITGNGRSLLLPVNVKNVKKFKIISASDLKMDNIKVLPSQCQVVKKVVPYAASSSSESVDDIDIDLEHYGNERSYPALQLTPEEKRLLVKEGIKLPTHYPLTKHEEKELKRIRRKIRNKISAQDSRKRKKEYVDQLEEKARRTDEENEVLKKRVKMLNRENTRLFEQLKKLQELMFNSTGKATPTTCLMIVLFSTLLVCLPNLRTSNSKDLELSEQQLATSARRALLFNKEGKDEDEPMSLEEFLVFNKEEAEARMDDEVTDNGSGAFVKYLGVLSKKYEAIIKSNCSEILQGGTLQEFCKKHEEEFKLALQNLRSIIDQGGAEEKKFIEPDISDDEEEVFDKQHHNAYLLDDDDPPTKKVRISSESMEYDKSPPLIQPVFEVEMAATTVEPKLFRLKTE